MEVLEFMKQKNRMCDYYVDGCTRDGFCEICPAHDMDCEITTDKPEQLVAVVEQWAKEHPEKTEQKRTNKDVLLAAFPDACMSHDGIPDACPLLLDKHYNCGNFRNCKDCRTTYWAAEAEE